MSLLLTATLSPQVDYNYIDVCQGTALHWKLGALVLFVLMLCTLHTLYIRMLYWNVLEKYKTCYTGKYLHQKNFSYFLTHFEDFVRKKVFESIPISELRLELQFEKEKMKNSS